MSPRAPWQDRLETIIAMMREMSTHTDPQAMVAAYGERVRLMLGSDGWVSVSRRGMEPPGYRITRSWKYERGFDPWRDSDKLAAVSGGLMQRLLYEGEPVVLNDFEIAPDDPAREHLEGFRTLVFMPQFEGGVVINSVAILWRAPNAFDPDRLPEVVWMANLFGRATSNLVAARRLEEANRRIDREMQTVADIQRSLLPAAAPASEHLDVATHYRTSTHAGGDYYDFFPLSHERLGLLVADVAGHGAPAAVLMAILHAIAHLSFEGAESPARLLTFVNRQLVARYTSPSAAFVTAFYGIFDAAGRRMTYAIAGHPPPMLRSAVGARVAPIDGSGASLPLGIIGDTEYHEQVVSLTKGDLIAVYTDGITETRDKHGEFFGDERVAAALERAADASEGVERILRSLHGFAGDGPPADDRTLVVARIR